MLQDDAGASEALVSHTFQVDEWTEVRAYVQAYKGTRFAHIRRFKCWNKQDEYKPEKGISVPVELLPQLLLAAALLMGEHGGTGDRVLPTAEGATA